MIERQPLVNAFDTLLQPERFKDFGPNGLQVEGRNEISKIVSGVTASLALIDAAVALHADAILVHHGLFWRGQDGRVTGWLRQRLGLLLHTTSICLPTICRWMPIPSWAITRNWARTWVLLPMPVLVSSNWAGWARRQQRSARAHRPWPAILNWLWVALSPW